MKRTSAALILTLLAASALLLYWWSEPTPPLETTVPADAGAGAGVGSPNTSSSPATRMAGSDLSAIEGTKAPSASPRPAKDYCSLEVGLRGVKGRLFSLSLTDTSLAVTTRQMRSINLGILDQLTQSSISVSALSALAKASDSLMSSMKELSPSCLGFSVVEPSVGFLDNSNELAVAMRGVRGIDSVEIVSADDQFELFLISAIRRIERATSFVVDVGSGNTKLGYLDEAGKARSALFPFGSVTLGRQIRELQAAENIDHHESRRRIVTSKLIPSIFETS